MNVYSTFWRANYTAFRAGTGAQPISCMFKADLDLSLQTGAAENVILIARLKLYSSLIREVVFSFAMMRVGYESPLNHNAAREQSCSMLQVIKCFVFF